MVGRLGEMWDLAFASCEVACAWCLIGCDGGFGLSGFTCGGFAWVLVACLLVFA